MTERLVTQNMTDLYGEYYSKYQNGTNQVSPNSNGKWDEHPYTMSLSYGSRGRYNFLDQNNNLYSNVDIGSMLGTFTPPLTNNEYLHVINKLNEKIRGSGFSGSNFLIEGNQTVELLKTNATRIGKMFHYLRHGRVYDAFDAVGMKRSSTDIGLARTRKLYKNVYTQVRSLKKDTRNMSLAQKLDNVEIQVRNKRILEDASSLLLEYRYGVEPLWNDLHDSMASLAQRTVFPEKVRFKARRKIVDNSVGYHGGLIVANHGTTGIEMRVALNRPPTFSEQLNFVDVRGAMWEFTPWSFVVDWALPVNKWLGALDFAQTWDIAHMSTSVIYKGSSKATGVRPKEEMGFDARLSPSSTLPYAKTVSLTRTLGVLSFSDALQLTPETKSLEKTFSIGHIVNAIALMTQGATSFGKSLKF